MYPKIYDIFISTNVSIIKFEGRIDLFKDPVPVARRWGNGKMLVKVWRAWLCRMCSLVTMVNTVCCILEICWESGSLVLTHRHTQKRQICEEINMLTILTTIIISLCMFMSKHHVGQLKHLHNFYLFEKKKKRERESWVVTGRWKHKLGLSLLSVSLWTQKSMHCGNKILM